MPLLILLYMDDVYNLIHYVLFLYVQFDFFVLYMIFLILLMHIMCVLIYHVLKILYQMILDKIKGKLEEY